MAAFLLVTGLAVVARDLVWPYKAGRLLTTDEIVMRRFVPR